MVLLLATSAALAQDCTTAVVQLALDDAESAFEARDKEAFLAAMDRVDANLGCVRDPATPALAAELHRMVGLRGFLERDEDAAALAFVAARSIEPDYTFPLTVVPEHHPVQELYLELDPARGTTLVLAPPAEGSIRLDGRRAESRSTSWPQLMQVVSGTGGVVSTDYVWPSEPTPFYDVGVSASALPDSLADAVDASDDQVVTIYVETDVGITRGGIDRFVDERVAVNEDGAIVERSYSDAVTEDQGARFGFGAGLRFRDAVELGLRGNVVLGSKEWTTGYTLVDADGNILDYGQTSIEPRPSWLLQVEPRMRMYFGQQTAGAFYWMIGLPFTGLMGVEPEGQYPYTSWGPRGILGVTLGGGAMWRLGENTGLFMEIPFTLYLLGHGIESQQSTLVYPQPSTPTTSGYLYSGTLGLQRRF